MSTTSDVKVTPGSGANVATYSITEDAETKQIQRVGLNKSDGSELALPAALGTAADAASLPIALSTEGKAQLGALTEAAPGTDTASSGLNGRLQRLAQRITSLIAAIPNAAAGTDGSTTIATGGTAQNLFGGTVPTNGFEICNPDAANDLWVSDSTTAAANATGSYRVAANGGTYTTPPGYRPIQAVSIVGAVTAQKITARRW